MFSNQCDNKESLKMTRDSTTFLNSNEEINRTNSSFNSNGSPFRDNMQTMFDLNSDLNTDLNEFNAFFNQTESHYNQIERPQNPFHKNFESYKSQTRKHQYSMSFTHTISSELLPVNESALRKNPSQHLKVFGSSSAESKKNTEVKQADVHLGKEPTTEW